jgi:mono/diheme cytochrome c family protein
VRKKTFVLFGLLVVVLVVLVPWLVFRSNGDAARGADQVAAQYKEGQSIFQTNCGTCHTLYAAGTDGNYAPNLDELLAPNGPASETPEPKGTEKGIEGRVLNALENGVDNPTTPGRMPANILSGQQAEEVAQFVAHVAGEG